MDSQVVAGVGHDRSTSKKYWFLIDNLPYPFSWQELKDLFRKAVTYPGYVETPSFPEGRTNGFSWMIAHGERDARSIYTFAQNLLVRENRLSVHVFEIQKEAILLCCNCAVGENGIEHTQFPGVLGHELMNSRIIRVFMSQETCHQHLPSSASVIQVNTSTISIRVSNPGLTNETRGPVYSKVRPGNARAVAPTSSSTKRPPLTAPSGKREATTPRCSMDEEPRCINIYHVADSGSDVDFEKMLKTHGTLVKFVRHKSRGLGNGKALAMYQSPLQADHAAMELNRMSWGKIPLIVERPRTIVRPVIADGSGSRIPL